MLPRYFFDCHIARPPKADLLDEFVDEYSLGSSQISLKTIGSSDYLEEWQAYYEQETDCAREWLAQNLFRDIEDLRWQPDFDELIIE